MQMGLPVAGFTIGSNRNDILTRLIKTGEMSMAPVEPSLSPSMDIQVSSNFERMIFDLAGRDGAATAKMIETFRRRGKLKLSPGRWKKLAKLYAAGRLDDDETLSVIRRVYRESGELIDPHSAIGLAIGQQARRNPATPLVALATAHPAKFPDAVERATGVRPKLPERLGDLFDRPERLTTLPNDLRTVQEFVAGNVKIAA
jgi:threonine synthase